MRIAPLLEHALHLLGSLAGGGWGPDRDFAGPVARDEYANVASWIDEG